MSENKIAEEISGDFIKKTPQIEQNQKIVNELILHYKNSHSSDYDLRSFVEEIIKTATGKDIQEIQSQDDSI